MGFTSSGQQVRIQYEVQYAMFVRGRHEIKVEGHQTGQRSCRAPSGGVQHQKAIPDCIK